MTDKFKDKRIAVIGLGIEGLSSVKFLKKKGSKVTVLDKKQGKDYLKNLDRYDLVVRSPGVKLELLEKYVSRDKITSQIKLFFDLCPCPIIGVTGTKGKGTTSSLIYEMLRKQDFDAYLGGNIGKPPLDFLDKLNAQSKVVLELSSFQLQDLTKSPHIAIMLMTTSEHLDYHKDTHEYVNSKRNVLRFQNSSDIVIVNKDYPASNESDIHTTGKVYKVSRENVAQDGCYVEDGKIKARTTFGKNKTRVLEIIKTGEILLPGKHNLENVCAAVMAAILLGVSKENIIAVLRIFRGLEHRLELVGKVSGVRFYDDSFSTIPETTIAAIGAFKDPEILILGGSSKNSDFKELGEVISSSNNIKAIIGIGAEWPRIQQQLTINNSQLTIIEGLKNMGEVVQKAVSISEPGDVVLLSPACASFDMFKNYKDRGDKFKKEVRKLI
ncbi:MAG: UDP-N-acetylmuramoylalanine--D-glutamate ligase [Candidatus Levybacteria bacterium RIFCSPLOWO2_01_FULL_36_13]|nr:MAG: UDP-N-acetylmuramoylalanine--D-glutamate ligase [Candidatus Levybacteria bacterium RIFCSPLOWO2_01_FULL_36_13]